MNLKKIAGNYVFALCAALASPLSFAADPVAPCGPMQAVNAAQNKGASYRVSVNIIDLKSKGPKTTFEALVDEGGAVAPIQIAEEISQAHSEPIVVGTFAALQAVPKDGGRSLNVCARVASLESHGTPLKVNESMAMLEMPLVVGEESRTMIGSDEMIVKVTKVER